jgi:hypothetical protein
MNHGQRCCRFGLTTAIRARVWRAIPRAADGYTTLASIVAMSSSESPK